MGFKMQIKSFNREAQGLKCHYEACDSKCHSVAWGSKWHYEACDSKCHSGAQGSECEYLAGSIQTLNMLTAPLSLLLSAELNHSIVWHGVQNGITKHVIQNAILGHGVQNAN
jgi:hypothetical protein